MSLYKRENIGVYTNPKNELYVGPADIPGEPSADGVILHVRATGICGSDIHFWKEGRVGDTMVVRDEHILGHESAGEVIAVGANVTNVKVGDRVAIEPGDFCGKCKSCTHGYYNACPHVEFKSTPPFNGLLRRYLEHPAYLCHKIGDMSFKEGALLEPISVGLAGIKQSGLKLGDATLIAGAGPIGIIAAMLARAAGAAPIAITDLSESRLEFSKKMIPGIRTVLVDRSETPQQVAERIITTMGMKPSVALECTGFESSIQAAIYSLDVRGVCEIIGVGKDFVNFPFMHQSVNEIAVYGLFRYANTWPTAIRLVNEKLLDAKPLANFEFKLEDGVEAFNTASNPASGAVKVIISDESD